MNVTGYTSVIILEANNDSIFSGSHIVFSGLCAFMMWTMSYSSLHPHLGGWCTAPWLSNKKAINQYLLYQGEKSQIFKIFSKIEL